MTRRGAWSTGQTPLRGVRVLELAGIGPAPFCAMHLADMGADVVRVDRPDLALNEELPVSFDLLNRGKRSILADLKDHDDRETVLKLVAEADIFIEGMRPGVTERLGVGPEQCHERNPALVYGRMTGWGQVGPLAQTAGHDLTYIAITGALHAIGMPGGAPQVPLNLIGDFAGAGYLTTGVLAALHEARRSGAGQVVDAAIVDAVAHLLTMIHGLHAAGMWRDERGVNLLDGGAPFYGVYETSDGKHMAVGAIEPQFFHELLVRLGIDPRTVDQRDDHQWPALRSRLAEVFVRHPQDHWSAVFAGTDACVAPVLSLTAAADHPHLQARSTFVRSDDGVRQAAAAPRFSGADLMTTPSLPCAPGNDRDAVLSSWLGNGRHSPTRGART